MMRDNEHEPAIIVIMGASGDLTQRKLAPALASLACAGLLSEKTRIIGVARTEMSDDEFRDRLYEGIQRHARLKPGESPDEGETPELCRIWATFASHFTYLSGAYDEAETYQRLGQLLTELTADTDMPRNCLFYLATPPVLYPVIVAQIGKAGLGKCDGGWTRIIIEKPFGRDVESARQLNDQVHAVFEEDQVYRIDHYLGKETVQNLMAFRFANGIFEPLWGRNFVHEVQITVSEQEGVEHRAKYYDQTGVLRDMLQNHLLQLLTIMAMEPPAAFNAKSLRDEKVKVLQAVHPIDPADVVRGQYVGYRNEPDVAPNSRTPTFVALRILVDNWRWKDVPFYLRTGKQMGQKLSEIALIFKEAPHQLFPSHIEFSANRITFSIQPDEGIHLCFGTKIPGLGMDISEVDMAFDYEQQFGSKVLPEAYERLLLDAIQGDASLFTRSDEIEHAWRLLDPLLALENDPKTRLAFYEPGGEGPVEADDLLERFGCVWQTG